MSHVHDWTMRLQDALKEIRVGFPEMLKQKLLNVGEHAMTYVSAHSTELLLASSAALVVGAVGYILYGCYRSEKALEETLANLSYATARADRNAKRYWGERTKNEELEVLLEIVNTARDNLRLTNVNLEEERDALISERNDLQEDISELKFEYDNMESDRDDEREERQRLESELDGAEERIGELESDLEDAVYERDQYKASMLEADSRISDLETLADTYQDLVIELENPVESPELKLAA